MSYGHQTCTNVFSKVRTTLQYPKCWVVTTSGIAGFQGNSIKYHILDKDGTQTLLLDSFKVLHVVHNSNVMVLGVTWGADSKIFNHFFAEKDSIGTLF